jgi:hypothetical protein
MMKRLFNTLIRINRIIASLPITISGSGTNFYNGSFTNASNIRFRQGSELLRVNSVSSASNIAVNVTIEILNSNSLGSYHVDVYDYGLSSFVTLQNGFTVIQNSTQIPELLISKFSIYPNPSSGMFSIVVPEHIASYNIRVHDQIGNVVVNKKNQTNQIFIVNLSKFSKGVYFITLTNGESIFESKLIKN